MDDAIAILGPVLMGFVIYLSVIIMDSVGITSILYMTAQEAQQAVEECEADGLLHEILRSGNGETIWDVRCRLPQDAAPQQEEDESDARD